MDVVQTIRARLARLGPRIRDVVFLSAAALTAVAIAMTGGPWRPGDPVLLLVVGLAGSAALWWRRRWPGGVTLIGTALMLLTLNPVPMIVGLFTFAIRRRDRQLLALTTVVAGAVAYPQIAERHVVLATNVVGALLVAGFTAAAGAYIGARRDLLASLRERAERAEAERELRAAEARTAERARIAREMHDVLAHKVSLIALHAGALEVASAPAPDRVEETAALIRGTARQALEELREVLGILRDESGAAGSELRPQHRAVDIRRLVDASRSAGVHTELVEDAAGLPDATARTAHRVVQEALTNVHKHARGAATSVVIRGDERSGVTVIVENRRPVAAGSILPGSGTGLLGLRERMRLIGGTLTAGPADDGGWRVVAWMPWSSSAHQEGLEARGDEVRAR